MRSFQIISFDSPPELTEGPAPEPAEGEVLLKIAACGLNFADLLMAQGRYQDTPDPPFTLGMEVCGTVIGHGPGVTAPALGTRVAVFGGEGGLAELGCFPAALCRPVPDTMSDTEAAGFQVAYGTSHLALTRRARLRPGETLLVTGAAGGVGLTAVEVGAAMGARVIGIARGADKRQVVEQAGATLTLEPDDPELIGKLKAEGGIDVAYDAVGGDLFTAALKAANREARLLAIGFASGDVPQVPANHLLVKNVDVMGFYWGGYLKFAPEALTDSLAELMAWHGEGHLKPHISHCLPLEQAGEALELIRSRRSTRSAARGSLSTARSTSRESFALPPRSCRPRGGSWAGCR